MLVAFLLILPVAAAVAAEAWRPRLAGRAVAAAAVAMTAVLAVSASAHPLALDLGWYPPLGSRFSLAMDPLGTPLALYAAGMAVPVLVYATAYMPAHLAEEGHGLEGVAPFGALLLGFALAMVLLMLAQDLLLIFLALELTAIVSFLLIRFDQDREAREAARLALVLTGGSSLLFLAGLVIVAAEAGTTDLATLREPAVLEAVPDSARVCLALGVLAKSAQVPLHFWLPRAMAAPTPVSAYLHSAALVAAGVFVLLRIRPLLVDAPWLLDGLLWLGFASIVAGGLFALVADRFKRVLAYSTIAQYGYGLVLVGAGGPEGIGGAAFFIVAHGLGKAALFMTAGAVTQATGEERLSRSGGLMRALPVLGAASLVATATVAGLPLTIGFFKDEVLLKAALEHGPLAAAFATLAVGLTLAYLARFWFGIFGGPARRAERPAPMLVGPVVALGVVAVLGGVWPAPLAPVFAAAAAHVAGEEQAFHLRYPGGLTPDLALTLAGWAGGALLWLVHGRLGRLWAGLDRLAGIAGPAALTARASAAAAALSDFVHGREVRGARDRLTAVFLVTAAIVLLGLWADGRRPDVGDFEAADLPLAAALVVAAVAAPVAVLPVGHLAFVLLLSFVGLSLSFAFALAHAPDVALVLALVEAMLTLLFIASLSHMRHEVLIAARAEARGRGAAVVGALAGLAAAATAWVALSWPSAQSNTGAYVTLTEEAHGKDVVTVILADFRGLDTAGEITVLVIAITGAVAIWTGRTA